MKNIQAIIFDLGGVILDIDYHRTANAFINLRVDNFSELFSQLKQDRLFDDFEKGLSTHRVFATDYVPMQDNT